MKLDDVYQIVKLDSQESVNKLLWLEIIENRYVFIN